MKLVFLDIGAVELIIVLLGLLIIIAIGNFGKKTALGFVGSILLAIITTPVIAFFVILYLRSRNSDYH